MSLLKPSVSKTLLTLAYPGLEYLGLTWFEVREQIFANVFLFIPALINLGLLGVFASSLISPPPLVEKFARLWVQTLSEDEIRYCRNVTRVWCVFFVGNGSLSAGLAVYGSLEAWTAYNGGIAYLLMGALFTSEFLYRHWRFRRYVGTPLDPILRRLFPPAPSDGC